MSHFKIQAHEPGFDMGLGGATNSVIMEAKTLEELLLKIRTKHPGVRVANIWTMLPTLGQSLTRFKQGEMIFADFEKGEE